MRGMMRDKEPERGMNSGKSAGEICSKRKMKKKKVWGRGEIRKARKEIHININNLSLSEREREREGEKGGARQRDEFKREREMEGGG